MLDHPNAGKALLLVEDEPIVAMVAQQLLEDGGFDVIAVSSGAEALSRASSGAGALRAAVVDLGLPDMGGDELVRRLRSTLPELPVIIASGYGVADLRFIFAGQPRIAFVAKPYDSAALQHALSDLGVHPPA